MTLIRTPQTSSSLRQPAAVAAIAAVVLGLLAGCGPNVPGTVRIGVAQPLSGPSAARGQDLLNGVKLAVAELNATGFKIAGKPVKLEVVALDDKADKDTARQVAQQLVDQKVTAVVGDLSSDISESTIPIYKQGNVLQLFTSSAADLTRLGDGNTFRLVANDALQARAIAGYLGETVKSSKVAIVFEDTAFGRPMSKDVSESLAKHNRQVPLNEAVDNKTIDFAGFVAKLKAAPPDALVAVLRDNQLIPLLQQMKAAGLSELPVVATNAAKTEKLVNAPADVKTLYLTSSALDPREFAAGPAFVSRFRAAYRSDPVWAAHYAYDAVFVLADAMGRVESADPALLRAKLQTIDANAPVTGSMRFDAQGEQRYGAVTVYQRRAGNWEALLRSDKW